MSHKTPKQKMPFVDSRGFKLPPEMDGKYDHILSVAFKALDKDDFEGFWGGIDDLNALVMICKEEA